MSAVLTGIATSILLPIARKAAAPVLKSILEKAGLKDFDGAVDAVVDMVAGKAGVTPAELPSLPPEAIETAVIAAEHAAIEDPAIMAAYVESQRLAVELQTAEIAAEPRWTWAWRPAWMWLLAFIWFYALVLRPLANAAFGASIEAVDTAMLMTLTGAYLALYMGGHTVKDVVDKVKGR